MKQLIKIVKNCMLLITGTGFVLAISVVPAAAQPIQPSYRFTSIAAPQSNSSLTVYSVATNAGGDSFTTGNFAGTVNFAGSGGNDTVASLNGGGLTVNSGYLTKRHSDGSYVWTRTTAFGPGSGYVEPSNVAVDASGNVYEYGYFSGDVFFDGPGGTHEIDTGGVSSLYITKYDASGTYLSTHTAMAAPNQGITPHGFISDTAGNTYFSGSFQGAVDFGISWGSSDIQTTNGNNSVFLTKVNANGSYGWTKTFDATNGDASSSGLAIDPTGALYLTGYYSDTIIFDGNGGSNSLTDTTGNGGLYIAKFLSNGSFGWVRGIVGDNSNSYVGSYGIAADATGGVYITGYLYGAANFDATGGTDVQSDSTSSGTTFTTKYLSSGAYGWTKTFDNSPGSQSYSSSYGQAITTDALGNVYVLSADTGPINYAGSGDSDIYDQNQSGALTKYNADGSYAWTRTFETLNGSTAVTAQGVYAGIKADTLGNVYVASVFNGTVGFDGPGGSDQQTSSGYSDTFLTSYRTFDPLAQATTIPVSASQAGSTTSTTVVSSPNSITTATTKQVQVPNTGYGVQVQSSSKLALLIAIFSLLSVLIGWHFKTPAASKRVI